MRSKTTGELLAEFYASPEIKTPLELQSFLRCSDEGIREISNLIVALCEVTDKWREMKVADWTLYPRNECYRWNLCPEAEALDGVMKEYDTVASVDAPKTRWLFLARYSRPAVGDETIKGTDAYNAYHESVSYATAKINFELGSSTATRFEQFAREGRYDEIEDAGEVRDFTDGGPKTTGDDLPKDDLPPWGRNSMIICDPRFWVKRSVFINAFTRVAECVLKNEKTSAWRCVKVSVYKRRIILTAANGRLVAQETISDRANFRVSHSGSFLVEPNGLLGLFSDAPKGGDERLFFALHFSFLTIKSARFCYRTFVEACDPRIIELVMRRVGERPRGGTDVIPKVPEFCEDQEYFEMESETLRRLIRRSRLAVDGCYEMIGEPCVTMIFKESETWATATYEDSICAWQRGRSQRVSPNETCGSFSKRVARVSAVSLKRVEMFLTDSESVKIALSDGLMQVQTENALLVFPTRDDNVESLRQIFTLSKKDAPNGRFFAGDLKTALRCLFDDKIEATDLDDLIDGEPLWNNESEKLGDDVFRLDSNDKREVEIFDIDEEEEDEEDEEEDYEEDYEEDDDEELVVTLELRNKKLVVSKSSRTPIPPFVEIPLKFCGNRVSVTLNARSIYKLVCELPPEEPVVIHVDDVGQALFETRDGFKYLAIEETTLA